MKLRAWALVPLVLLVAACGSSTAAQSSAAAVVNGHQIPMEAYNAEFQQQRVSAIDTLGYDPCAIKQLATACKLIKQRSLNNVIKDELEREYAVTHGIQVSPAEDNVRWQQVFQRRFDSRQDVEHAWLRRVGISEADLRRGLHQDLLEQKVIYAVTVHLSQYQPSVRVAQIELTTHGGLQQVEGYLKRHIPFVQVATLALRDDLPGCTSSTCGDLGWTPDAFVPANRRQLLTVPVGTVIGPIQEQQDWLFLQPEARNPHYKLTSTQMFELRELKFVGWVQRQVKLAKVTKYVAV